MPDSVVKRGVNATKWNFVGHILRAVAQLGFGILLARLLPPNSFGLVAIALSLIGLGALISDSTFSASIVQKATLTEHDVDTSFTIQASIGIAFSITMFLLAAPLAALLADPLAEPVIAAMAPLFLLRALGQSAKAELIRNLDFKRIQISAVGSYVVSFGVVGVLMAVQGYGVWSLVCAQLLQVSLESFGYLLARRRVPRLRLEGSGGMLRFGSWVIGANLSSWIFVSADVFLIARMLGTTELGLYNRTMVLLMAPASALLQTFQPLTFSMSSRMNESFEDLRRIYSGLSKIVAFLAVPLFAAAMAIAEPLILALYGTRWIGAVPLVAPLALAMIAHLLLGLIGPVLMAINRTSWEVSAQWMYVFIAVPALYLAAQASLTAVAWAVAAIYWGRLFGLQLVLGRAIRIGFRDWAQSLLPSLLTGFFCYLITRLIVGSLPHSESAVLLLIAALANAGTLAICLLIGKRRLLPLADLASAGVRLPPSLKKWLS